MAANGFAPARYRLAPPARVGGAIARQLGSTLIALLAVLVLLGSVLLIDRLRFAASPSTERRAATAASLAEAKAALIAWSATASSSTGARVTPGLLPFPDRNGDGNYDGKGDCVTFGLNPSHLLGRLPWAGDARPCPRIGLHVDVRDAGGERLWYAVSRNLVTRGGGGPVNPGMGEPRGAAYPWIVVRDADGNVVTNPTTGMPVSVAAVIIAPGAALEGQDRNGTAPAPENYLDRISIGATIYDNSDSDGCPDAVIPPCGASSPGEEFIVHPGARAGGDFNDRLVYITVEELMRAVQRRVLGEVAIALNGYRGAYGAYPWLASFTDPASAAYKSDLSRGGLLPVHLPGEIFSTGFSASWNLIDATPTTVARHSGNPSLTPPLADLESGRIEVNRIAGRCRWSDWTRADCAGSRILRDHFRADLGASVTRTVEVSFSIVDDTPEVTPPAAADVRRRALSLSGSALSGATWDIRVIDDDGIDRGERRLSVDANTVGTITVSGIRYDLSVVYDDVHDRRDELPEWFAENDWHHFVYAAFSSDAVAGGDGDCPTPEHTCLTVNANGTALRTDVRALVLSAGAAWAGQDRTIGDCDGDGVGDDFLCAYFEGDNSDKSTAARADTYARDRFSIESNDQLRVVAPLPP
jgi:hypothetical protein